ncbi:hypothetical protein M9Y10_034025 [Tritrichomonas musculus]|uniref:UBC core domain-containing protein n=1 Tax=Tritrichomonas musculus TaxID=1915356 RepID=A0ABR2KDY1_9EUKA
MSSKIKFFYSLKNVPKRSFVLLINKESTVKDVLEKLSERYKETYTTLFYFGSEIDSTDLIIDYIEDNPQCIFTASLDSEPPSNYLIKKTISSPNSGTKIPPPKIPGKESSKPIAAQITVPKVPEKDSSKPIAEQIIRPKIPPPKIPGKDSSKPNVSIIPKPKIPGKDSIKAISPLNQGIPEKPPGIRPGKAKELSIAKPPMNKPKEQFTSQPKIEEPYDNINHINAYYDLTSTPIIEHSDERIKLYSGQQLDIESEMNFVFYFTGGDKNMLLNGIQVNLLLSMNANECNEALKKYIKDIIDTSDKILIVYLPGGIPFTTGKLGDIFTNKKFEMKNVIYGVLTRLIPEEILSGSCGELCNIKDDNHKKLISPLVDSTDLGMSDMACLIGYFNYYGFKSGRFLKSSSAIIHFPPLITSLKRIIERNDVVGRDVVTVTSTLYSYFRGIIPSYCPDNKIFEYSLLLCNLIYPIYDDSDDIPLFCYQIKEEDKSAPFFSNFKPGETIYYWKGDAGIDFAWLDFQIPIDDAIENLNYLFDDFSPKKPLSLKNVSGCSIVKGKDHEYLYIMKSYLKDSNANKNGNLVDIVNPMTGTIESKDIESFDISQERSQLEITTNLIIPDRVKQIIVVIFDESELMYTDLNGDQISLDNENPPRITIAYQLLSMLLDKMYYSIRHCIQSLVSFDDDILVRYPFGPINPNSLNSCMKKEVCNSQSKLWDSLSFSCKEITKFRKDVDGNEIYKNAQSRILVISAGKDNGSSAKLHNVVEKLIKNKIVVDSVVLNTCDRCKRLCAACHATGGLSFRPKNIQECFDLAEQSAFFNYEERKINPAPLIPGDKSTIPFHLESDQITKKFMKNARQKAKFDNKITNEFIIQCSENLPLATPRHICSKFTNSLIPHLRTKRILYELHFAAEVLKKESSYYDPDLKIYLFQSQIDMWKVFIRSPDEELYDQKWWYLFVKFPELYPFRPPIIKFVSVPYHLNIAKDGHICINALERNYNSSRDVYHIIQEIKELFLLPDLNTPISSEMHFMYKDNRDMYVSLAKQSAEVNGKNDFKDFVTESIPINDDVPDGFTTNSGIRFPSFNEMYMKPKSQPKKSSVAYDKEELKQQVTSNKNPIYIITGKPLNDMSDEDDCI